MLRGLVNAFCLRRNANPFKFMACHCFGIKLSECTAREREGEGEKEQECRRERGGYMCNWCSQTCTDMHANYCSAAPNESQ